MFNNVALDVVIGLVFVYLLYSLLGTLIQEIIATNLRLRSWVLEIAIKRMLDDDTSGSDLSQAFYAHPLIKYLANRSWLFKKKPSYIDRETFSKVVIDLLRGQDVQPGSSDRQPIQNSLTTGKIAWKNNVTIPADTALYLKSIWADAQGDVQKFKASLEQWFDEMMDRTTGWYKKYTQRILFVVGFVIAMVFNVDTIKIINVLQNNPKLREQVINQAAAFAKVHPNLDKELAQRKSQIDSITTSAKDKEAMKKAADSQYAQLKFLNDNLNKQATGLVGNDISKVNNVLSMGWPKGFLYGADDMSILGWLLTAFAISLGAPFWFDLLNKLMQLRSSVAPKDDNTAKNAKADGNNSNITKRVG